MEEKSKINRSSLKEIKLPVKLVSIQFDQDSSVEYYIYDASNRLIAALEWNEQGKKDGELLVQFINSTNF